MAEPQKQDNTKPLPESLKAVRAALRGQEYVPSLTEDKVLNDIILPVSAARQGEANILKSQSTGQMIEGPGIYIGTWEPEDCDGKSLGKIFNLYAAPEDIRQGGNNLLMTYNEAVQHVAGLRNWHGHDGALMKNSYAIRRAVQDTPKELEKWFIPTKEILHGKNRQGDKVQRDNLFEHRDKMPGGSEFVTSDNGTDHAHWYWSCTEIPNHSWIEYFVDFTKDEDDNWTHKDMELSIRPVRAELVTKSMPQP